MDKSKIFIDAEGLYQVAFTIENNILKPYIVVPESKIGDKAYLTCVNNLNKMLRLEASNGEEYDVAKHADQNIEVKIGKMKVGSIENYQTMGEYQTELNAYNSKFHLTTFELKMLSQGNLQHIEELGIPFDRAMDDVSVKTDLHTHFTGVLYSDTLLNIGIQNDVKYPHYLLQNLGIDVEQLKKDGMKVHDLDGCESFSLRDILQVDESTGAIGNQKLYDDICKNLSIPTNEQKTFVDMDKIYDFRWPFYSFTNNDEATEKLFKDVLFNIGKQYGESGVTYTELAITSLRTDSPHVFDWMDKYLPQIEKETGVKIRFLAGIPRSFSNERMGISTKNIFNIAKSPYVVGCDFLGHEINSTKDFEQTLRNMAEYAMLEDPSFVIRVHSGESAVHLDNTIQVFEIIEDVQNKLIAQGKNVRFPQVRIGHSLNGVTEELKQKCKLHGAIIEKNYSSNLSLNNISNLDDVVIKDLIDSGVKVVLGSDGPGIYHTDARQESTLVKGAGCTNNDIKKIVATENEYISNRDIYFKNNMQKYLNKIETNTFITGNKEDAIRMTLSSGRANTINIDTMKNLDKQNKSIQDKINLLREECNRKSIAYNSNKFKEDKANKKPIYVFGHTKDEDIEKLGPREYNILVNHLQEIITQADIDNSYFVINAANEGLSKLFMKVYKSEQTTKNLPEVLGLTVPSKAGETSLLPVNALEVNERSLSEFNLAQSSAGNCKDKDGEMYFFGGSNYVSDIIVCGHNSGCKMYLDQLSGGVSNEKAKAYGLDYPQDNTKYDHVPILNSINATNTATYGFAS